MMETGLVQMFCSIHGAEGTGVGLVRRHDELLEWRGLGRGMIVRYRMV